jgi:5-methylcytosine-specific restriction endonuclease McrA
MKLSASERQQLRHKFGGRCAYCGCVLNEKGWHADHVEPVLREMKYVREDGRATRMVATGKLYRPENDRIENLFPACAPCNIDKAGASLEDWRRRIFDLAGNLRRNSSAFRHAERFARVQSIEGPLVFWFETLTGKVIR